MFFSLFVGDTLHEKLREELYFQTNRVLFVELFLKIRDEIFA